MATHLFQIKPDRQRRDRLPCYGLAFMRTLALDGSAVEGLVFDRCIVPSPVREV
ncbi:MAG: hypothetical protein J4F39_08890 [Candidatus Latescibacteria bacterium]|nr:hypothetical protein [Candidatus Latescibacterota bacterium]